MMSNFGAISTAWLIKHRKRTNAHGQGSLKDWDHLFKGEGLLTQMAFVPWNFDAGTLLLRHMGWLLTQGPLTHRILTQGGF